MSVSTPQARAPRPVARSIVGNSRRWGRLQPSCLLNPDSSTAHNPRAGVNNVPQGHGTAMKATTATPADAPMATHDHHGIAGRWNRGELTWINGVFAGLDTPPGTPYSAVRLIS